MKMLKTDILIGQKVAEYGFSGIGKHNCPDWLVNHARETEERLIEAEQERDEAREELAAAKREAEYLAKIIHRSEYSDSAPNWGLCDSVAGVISQIDNMYAEVRAQRDEARRLLEETRRAAALDRQERDNLRAYLGVSQYESSNYDLRERVKNVTKQRDEAMQIAEVFCGLVCYGMGTTGENWSIENMRDAREAIHRFGKMQKDMQ